MQQETIANNGLFSPITIGKLQLPNRIIMAPLTRNRAGDGNVPTDMNALYYQQRASAGLIISEATQVSPQGVGYPHTPGIHSNEQVTGWQKVTNAVHDAGGRIFLQLWHVGRISHPSLQPNGELPVAPSEVIPGQGQAITYEGMQDYVTPRALAIDELSGIVNDYREAAKKAMQAGFDGVEVHCANGYLLDQFLRDGTNKRSDKYGGSMGNRARLPLEVITAVQEVWPRDAVGVRISPCGTFNDMSDSDPEAMFGYFVEQLNDFELAYLHIIEAGAKDMCHGATPIPTGIFRKRYAGRIMVNGGFDLEKGQAVIRQHLADMVCYGKPFIANPDLPERFCSGAPLNEPDPESFYGGDEKGYIDYPTLKAS